MFELLDPRRQFLQIASARLAQDVETGLGMIPRPFEPFLTGAEYQGLYLLAEDRTPVRIALPFTGGVVGRVSHLGQFDEAHSDR